MIKDLERAWQQRSKGEADLSDIYERFTRATLSCRQVVTKRLTIITSLVDYHEQWKLVSETDELCSQYLLMQYCENIYCSDECQNKCQE